MATENVKKYTSTSYLPLIERWEKFLTESRGTSVEDFARWVLNEGNLVTTETTLMDSALQVHFDKTSQTHEFAYLSPEASFLLWRLYKFLRFYTKTLFRDLGLSSHDEFAILAHIDYKKECSKKVAIEENLIDLTTGTDIIKRLVGKGLIAEKVNVEDRREKILTLTVRGEKILQEIYSGFTKTQDLLADLTAGERENLVTSLKNLDEFHSRNYK